MTAPRPYLVHDIFYTLCGEGMNTGRPAVFCRFAGCNLWTGREADRAGATCRFCDTDFVGGDRYAGPGTLADAVAAAWPGARPGPGALAVLTGGEPTLQADAALVDALHARGFAVAIETNGTLPLPPGLDHVCVSPKAGAAVAVTAGDELKLVYPQAGVDPVGFEHLAFRRFYLQPMDGPDYPACERAAVEYCLAHPRWSLSLQIQKHLGLK